MSVFFSFGLFTIQGDIVGYRFLFSYKSAMNERDLRLILTKDCNYRCTFCHHEGVSHDIFQALNNEDYLFLYDTIKQQQNIKDVSLTWWEPLLYPKIESLCKVLYDRWAKITLVTNGSLLNMHHELGKWVHRINVSLHTLNQSQYADITQTKTKIEHIIYNIELMRKLYPNLLIRLNATVVKWRNDNKEDLSALIDVADRYGLSIKFVELYPNTEAKFISLKTIEPILEELWFQKYQEQPRQTIYGRGKRIIILTRISCWATGEEDNVIPPEESDVFVSPDGLISPYPSTQNKVSLYDAIKKRDTKDVEKLLYEAIYESSQSKIGNHVE